MSCSDPWEGIHEISDMGKNPNLMQKAVCTCGLEMYGADRAIVLKTVIMHLDMMKVKNILNGE